MSSMKFTVLIVSVLAVYFISFTDASVAIQAAKAGEKVEIDIAQGAKALKRTVGAGTQIWKFDGKEKGFVDEKGKKVDSSNYEVTPKGVLIIKKVSKADAGSYEKEPNPPKITKTANGEQVGTAGAVLSLIVE